MSEARGIDLLLLLFFITAQAIRKPNGNRTIVKAVIHIEVLAFKANFRSRRSGIEEVIGMNRNRCPILQEGIFRRKVQIEQLVDIEDTLNGRRLIIHVQFETQPFPYLERIVQHEHADPLFPIERDIVEIITPLVHVHSDGIERGIIPIAR